jgi:hypothetical protein
MNYIKNLLKICLVICILSFSNQVWAASCTPVTPPHYYCTADNVTYPSLSACQAACGTTTTGESSLPPPEPDYYTLSVAGSQAHIKSNPTGIDCEYGEGSCSKTFDRGETVTLELVKINAVTGLTQDDYIVEWFGDIGCSNQKVVMNSNRSCAVRLYGKPGVDYSGTTDTTTDTTDDSTTTDTTTDTTNDSTTTDNTTDTTSDNTTTDNTTDTTNDNTTTDNNTTGGGTGIAIPPLAPTNLQVVSKINDRITLSWQDNSDNEAGFHIYQNGVLIKEILKNLETSEILNLSCQTNYTFQVIAFNSAGQNGSETISTSTAICPPSDFVATTLTENQIQLSWRDNSLNETGFPIARNGQFITISAANSEQFTDTNLSCGTEYLYQLYATDSIINVGGIETIITPACNPSSETNYSTISSNPLPIARMGTELCGMAFTNQNLTTGNLKICDSASVTGGHLIGENINNGVIANFILEENASIIGGRISSFNVNNGTLQNVTITPYTEVTGGFYSGLINNNGMMTNNYINPNTTVYSSLHQGKLAGVTQNKGTIQGTMRLLPDSWLIGGTLEGNIIGSKKSPAYIGAVQVKTGATLQNVYLSPSVKLADNVKLINVKHALNIPEPGLNDFFVDVEQLNELNAENIIKIEPAAIALLDRYEVELIPANAFAGLSPEQLAAFQPETLSNVSIAQFFQLPLQSLKGLTAFNIGALSPEIIEKLTPEQLDALDMEAVQQSEQVAKLLTNIALTTPRTTIDRMTPQNWQVSATGKMTAPIGSKVNFKGFSSRAINQVLTPYLIEFQSSLSIGGKVIETENNVASTVGGGFNIGLQQTPSIDSVDLDQFIFTQNEYGIFNVVGTGDYEGIVFAFMPNANNIEQAPLDTPVGLSTIEGGYFEMITPDKQKFILINAPNNPEGLQQALGGESEVKLSSTGDVLMRIDTATTRSRNIRFFETDVIMVGCFDAFVEPAPNNFCANNKLCDFGMEFPADFGNFRARQQAKVTYPNGTAQSINPTVIYPNILVDLLTQYEIITKALYKADGTFEVIANEQTYNLIPDFNIKVRRLEPEQKRKPKVNLQNNVLLYEIQEGDDLLTFSLNIEVN